MAGSNFFALRHPTYHCSIGTSNRLFKNNRDGTFTDVTDIDVTEHAGLLKAGWACGVCVGDYDNEGFDDLFVTYWGLSLSKCKSLPKASEWGPVSDGSEQRLGLGLPPPHGVAADGSLI
jgi:hypothetical protein